MKKLPSKFHKVAYMARRGCFPYWTKGFAESKGPNLWLFSPYKDDHKVIVESDMLYFY